MKSNNKFWIRFALWALFACVVPFVFIAWRYKIFETHDAEIALTGWGLIALIIIFLFVFYLMKKLYEVLKQSEWTFTLQIISGVKNVILPLILIYFFIHNISESITLFEQCLILVIISEAIAIPINPIPEWEAKHKADKEEEKENKLINKVAEALGTDKKGEE